ncbi:SRPBCC domain-containing protein [Clavibacter sp. MX14-G9D]|uniref:SRPBCC family protein n=1 Tax=Clavibacter sp. MX14-G9D TaxID=3064656 RepID=UPI00293F3665|nr:SRPBCC domain-containing protein [Clavibacter sp. MX14-G9D]
MEMVRVSADVRAPARVVWDTMLARDTYEQWTGAFHEGSTYEGSWDEGAEIRFVGPGEDGHAGGLVGTVIESRRDEFVSIRYDGEIDRGTVSRESPIVGLHESYAFREADGVTTLDVELEVPDEWAASMREMWGEAVIALKRLAEAASASSASER